jgi:prepilin-type N-terminal cleavage/methylation domain-containing protein
MQRQPTSFLLALSRGFTLIEALVALTILLTGIVAIISFFPMSIQQNQRAVDTSIAAYLAQMKAEEIRREVRYVTGPPSLIDEIEGLPVPSPPLTFPLNPRFAYSFCGESQLRPGTFPNVARVIVQYDQGFRPQQEILYELAFDE